MKFLSKELSLYTFSILILLTSLSWNLEAQSTFEKKFMPSLNQYGREIFQTANNGFFLQGTIEQGWKNCYLIKTDSLGDTLWTKNYGTDSIQYYAYDMTKTSDGGYLICGDYQTILTFGSMDSYVQKIDSLGNQVWFNLFGWSVSQGGGKDHAQLIKMLDDGSIIVEGSTKDFYIGIGNYLSVGQGWRSYLAKFDNSGNMVQIKTVSLAIDTLWGQDYQVFDIETIGNRTYWLGINNVATFPNNGDITLVVFDANLDTVFTISNGLDDYYGLSKTNDNNLILFGEGVITKMDTTGAIIWTTTNSSSAFPSEIIETINGAFSSIGGTNYLSPFYGYFYNNQVVYLNQYSSSGTLTGSKVFNLQAGTTKQLGYNLVNTNDSGFVFVGYSNQSIWLVKTDSNGNVSTSHSETPLLSNEIKLTPNPANNVCIIYYKNDVLEINIFNINGTLKDKIVTHNNSYQIDVSNFPNAIYVVELVLKSGLKSRIKLAVAH